MPQSTPIVSKFPGCLLCCGGGVSGWLLWEVTRHWLKWWRLRRWIVCSRFWGGWVVIWVERCLRLWDAAALKVAHVFGPTGRQTSFLDDQGWARGTVLWYKAVLWTYQSYFDPYSVTQTSHSINVSKQNTHFKMSYECSVLADLLVRTWF